MCASRRQQLPNPRAVGWVSPLVRAKPTAFGRATLRGSADTGRTGPPSGIVEGTICLDPRTVHAFSLRRRRCTPEPRVSAAASRRSATLGNERNQIPYAEGVIQDSWRLLIFVERLRRTRFSNYDPGCAAHHGCAVAPATLIVVPEPSGNPRVSAAGAIPQLRAADARTRDQVVASSPQMWILDGEGTHRPATN